MICFYEPTIDDMIWAFIQIANYYTWLKSGSTRKRTNQASLKLKTTTQTRDLKLVAEAMKSFLGIENLNTRSIALEGAKIY